MRKRIHGQCQRCDHFRKHFDAQSRGEKPGYPCWLTNDGECQSPNKTGAEPNTPQGGEEQPPRTLIGEKEKEKEEETYPGVGSGDDGITLTEEIIWAALFADKLGSLRESQPVYMRFQADRLMEEWERATVQASAKYAYSVIRTLRDGN